MKAGHNKKSVRVEFVMSEQEAELVKERMAELGIPTSPRISARWRWTVISSIWT